MRVPPERRIKSASPCMITVRLLFSITPGRTVSELGRLASFPSGPAANTSKLEHSVQVTLVGAWIAFFTSVRSK
jgi:hypothetical protein